jgi:hypothetical protein
MSSMDKSNIEVSIQGIQDVYEQALKNPNPISPLQESNSSTLEEQIYRYPM